MMDKFSKKLRENRCQKIAQYMVHEQTTIRKAAKVFGLSKSTVHHDVTVILPSVNKELYGQIRELLDKNWEKRQYRGGLATRQRYMEQKLVSNIARLHRVS